MGSLFQYASPLEAIQAAMAFCGLLMNIWCMHDAWIDVQRARQANGQLRADDKALLRIVAIGNFRAEIVRGNAQLFFLALGLLSMMLPPSARPDHATMTERQHLIWIWIVLIRVGLMVSTGSMALNSLLNLRDRRAVAHRVHAQAARRKSGMDERNP